MSSVSRSIGLLIQNLTATVSLGSYRGLRLLAALLLLFGPTCISSSAQPVSWVQTDIGSTGATGTYSYSSGTYTIAGAGSGIGGTADSFSYVSYPTSGNIEMIAKVTSQTNTSAYAVAGLMIRDSLNANAREAVVGVSPQNGVNFTFRDTVGGQATTTLGPSITAPVWLRLVRSQSSIAGYQSSDGISWQLVGEQQISSQNPYPPQYYVGFAVCSNSFGNLSTAVFNNVNYMTSVPQRSPNLLSWLRSDVGVVSSSGSVSTWQDQSGNGNDATQGIGTNQPSLVTGAINGLPAISFNGTSSFLQFPSGFKDFTAGASIFIVAKPTSASSNYRDVIYFGTDNSGSNGLVFEGNSGSSSSISLYANSSSVLAASALTANQYQLLEGIESGGPTGTIYTNGIQQAQGSLAALSNLTRTNNYIGGRATNFFYQGQIAEILVYSTALTAAQRASIESYIYSKYAVGNQPTLDAPVITPPNSVFSTPTQPVSISQSQGANIWYTTDGSTPVPGTSTQYTGSSFSVTSSTTVKAIASAPFFSNSSVSSSFLQYDPATANVTKNGLLAWYKADNSVSTSGSNVTQWADVANGNNATQGNSSNQPTLVTNAVNGLPAINFNGTSQFLQIPSTTADFSQGLSIFVVSKPTTGTAGARLVDYGNGSTTDSLGMCVISTTTDQLFVFNSTTPGSLNGSLTLNQYQLLEAVQKTGSLNTTIFTNGNSSSPGTVTNARNVTRGTNFIGQQSGGGDFLQGQIAEILVYNSPLSTSDRQAVENYLMNRYAIGVQSPVITASPALTPPQLVYTQPVTVTMTAAPGASIYYTTDGSTPTAASALYTPGGFVLNNTTTVKAIAVKNFGSSSVSSLALSIDVKAGPLLAPGPFTWLRSDMGVSISTGSSVQAWSDMSGNSFYAGSSGTAQPSLVNNAINGYPALSFNGSTSYMQFPSTSADFTHNGLTIFVVANSNAVTSGARFFDFSTGAGKDSIALYAYSNTVDAFLTSTGTGAATSVAGNMTTGRYQLLEALQNSSGGVGMYTNGIASTPGSAPVPTTPFARNTNFLGQYSGGGLFFQGQMVELIVYAKALTTGQRAAIESYLLNKYQISIQAPPPPAISVATATLTTPTQVAIAAEAGSTVYYTTDGTTPTTSSPVYTGPINVYFTQTLNAIAVKNGIQSSVSTATYTLDSNQWPRPDASNAGTLQFQLQIPTNAIPQ